MDWCPQCSSKWNQQRNSFRHELNIINLSRIWAWQKIIQIQVEIAEGAYLLRGRSAEPFPGQCQPNSSQNTDTLPHRIWPIREFANFSHYQFGNNRLEWQHLHFSATGSVGQSIKMQCSKHVHIVSRFIDWLIDWLIELKNFDDIDALIAWLLTVGSGVPRISHSSNTSESLRPYVSTGFLTNTGGSEKFENLKHHRSKLTGKMHIFSPCTSRLATTSTESAEFSARHLYWPASSNSTFSIWRFPDPIIAKREAFRSMAAPFLCQVMAGVGKPWAEHSIVAVAPRCSVNTFDLVEKIGAWSSESGSEKKT